MSLKDFSFDKIAQGKGIVLGKVDKAQNGSFYCTRSLRNVYLNVTDTCNLNCIYCVNSLREESAKNLRLDDYKRLIDEIAAMNPKIGVIFTGGEALTSSITIPAAEYAKTRGLDFQPLFPFANPKLYDALKISGKDYFDAMTRASDNVIFHEFITKIPEHYRTKKTQIKCGLGDGQISISHSGDVYPCALLHNPLFKVGNIRENSLAEIYNSPALKKFKTHTADNISKCRSCDFKLIYCQ